MLPREIHLVIGPVGAGKSTFATALAQREGAVRLTLDAWMARLYGEDERPIEGRMAWYMARVERCLGQIWEIALQVAEAGTPVVLEVGLIRAADRARLYGWVDAAAVELVVHVVDAPREVRRTRVQARNRERGPTFSMEVPLEVFELASDLWEPPSTQERADRDIRDVATQA